MYTIAVKTMSFSFECLEEKTNENGSYNLLLILKKRKIRLAEKDREKESKRVREREKEKKLNFHSNVCFCIDCFAL